MSLKTRTARLSIWSNSLLIVMNFTVGILSGSVSIISEGIHTIMDLLAAIIAYFSVKISDTPPDEQHPYGHGKFENISGVIEAILIYVASGWIIYEAISKIMIPHKIENEGLSLGILVMFIGSVINYFVSKRLYRVAKETDSIALEADALHLKTHIYTSAGIGIGLILIYFTGWYFLDPIIAILVALFILKEATEILIHAYRPLTDSSLDKKEVDLIKDIIETNMGPCTSYHKLRTRKGGSHRYIDFHLEVTEEMSVKQSHDICDELENKIKDQISNAEVTIHVEPKKCHDDV
jgi:cation diffusion facilitator family transporter